MEFLIGQFFNFITAMGIGIIIGILFDVYRGLWKKCTPSSKIMPFWDVFWWIIVTALVFFILLNLNWGEMRLYIFLGQVAGFLFYFKKVSPHFLKRFILFLIWMEKTLKKVIMIILIPMRLIKNVVLFPFIIAGLIFNKTGKVIKKIWWTVKLVFRAIHRKCKKIFKKIFRISRNKK